MWITLNDRSRLQNCWNKSSFHKDTSSTVADSSTCSAMESSRNQSATCLFTLHIRLWTTLKLNWCVTLSVFSIDCSSLSADHFLVYILPSSCIIHAGYLRYYTALSKFVQFLKDRVWLLECSLASCPAPQDHCEEKRKKFVTRRINNKSPSHFSFDTCRHNVEFWKVGESIFFSFG